MHHATSGLGNPVLSSRAKMGKATEGIGFDVFEQLLRAQRCPSFDMIPIQVSTCFLPFVRETRVPDDYRRNAFYNTQLKVRMPM